MVLHVVVAVNHFWFHLLTGLEDEFELCRKSLVLHNIESTQLQIWCKMYKHHWVNQWNHCLSSKLWTSCHCFH